MPNPTVILDNCIVVRIVASGVARVAPGPRCAAIPLWTLAAMNQGIAGFRLALVARSSGKAY